MSDVTSASVYTDFSGINELKRQAKHNDPEAVKAVAQQFESMFLEMVLSSARTSNDAFSDDAMGSDQMDFMYNMLDQQFAQVLATKGVGFASMLEKHLSGES